MTATATRIGFVLEPYRIVTSETAGTAARHGNLARESDDPIDSWFAASADAQTRADARQTLLSADRRMFDVQIAGSDVEALLPLLASASIPTGRFVDEERGIDMQVIATEFVIDLDAQSATFKVWG